MEATTDATVEADEVAGPVRVRRDQLVEAGDAIGIGGPGALPYPLVGDPLEARRVDGDARRFHGDHGGKQVTLQVVHARESQRPQPRCELLEEGDEAIRGGGELDAAVSRHAALLQTVTKVLGHAL
jgi:hypothetical protein